MSTVNGYMQILGINEPRLLLFCFFILQITVKDLSQGLIDIYRLKFGFRTLKVTDKAFLINGLPFYFKGFGMHEDADVSYLF